ncbi:DUF4242 domain-containing protein [Inquilinus limosus]|uniref:DUF4242 domain-containing protein n=1 Tax=Inquilinus limosus TaxID=171674 RepID=UPI003F16D7D4
MKLFVIERTIPGIGIAEREPWWPAARRSSTVLDAAAPDIRWVESFVAADRTFCIFLAKDEETIRQHSDLSGLPATRITEIRRILDPTDA